MNPRYFLLLLALALASCPPPSFETGQTTTRSTSRAAGSASYAAPPPGSARTRNALGRKTSFLRRSDEFLAREIGYSLGERVYVIDPHKPLVMDGFHQSAEAVAAFRFSPVRESYAQEKYRNTRNVGVIGVGIFNERGTFPWTDREVQKRLKANPFPNRFATPP